MEMTKSKGKLDVNPDTGVMFDQVAGCDSAKFELEEVVDFLKNPDKYTKVGAKIPRGVILEGPPGTGKTLIARAVAGEAGCPFIATSGSEFVEMFVGVGAARVRDLFDKAKENSPCIIFIDEIDAVGRQRGSGMAGGNDEREQTLNQMLVEMDGFVGNPGVIVMAATNRIDILDDALLRPGRFDRRVLVDLPNFQGRVAILKVHARGKPLAPDVDIEGIARRTPGFSGAQLKNLLNEAAIFAARKQRPVPSIEWEDVDGAVDRLLVGLEKKGGRVDEQMRTIVAYHEAGHAIVGALMPDYDTVQKVTIVPRTNGAGGLTFFSPSEERLECGLYSKVYMESQLAVALGGRLAEELTFGEDQVRIALFFVGAVVFAFVVVPVVPVSVDLVFKTYLWSSRKLQCWNPTGDLVNFIALVCFFCCNTSFSTLVVTVLSCECCTMKFCAAVVFPTRCIT